MATLRFKALQELINRQAVEVKAPSQRTSEYFGNDVFDHKTMKVYLSREAYQTVTEAINNGTTIPQHIAEQVSAGMKAWAFTKGATHYTHWFHALTGNTAEKHYAFFEPTGSDGLIESFDGTQLIPNNTDENSVNSKGQRNIFEARGHLAWDPSSPAFVLDNILCIPTKFISYKGEALDFKTPMLKALQVMNNSATNVCRLFDKEVKKVQVNLNWEQEYFVVERSLFIARPDLMLTGRTLMGHASAKAEQHEDHYFGTIPSRVDAFIRDFEIEAYKLGIPLKNRHNELAPNQFECSSVFEDANLSIDHNMLLMDLMTKVSRRHHFKVLFHEKPFNGINGSGKHCHWMLKTNTGVNLLSPGSDNNSKIQFLVFLINSLKAIQEHTDLLRASIMSSGNEHRLDAGEAPPTIMTVFVGALFQNIFDSIEELVTDKPLSKQVTDKLNNLLKQIPNQIIDNTDNNRTSPIAFTGSAFEFRAVGANANPASPITFLTLAVADQLNKFKTEVDSKVKQGLKQKDAIWNILKKYIVESKDIIYNGDVYSDEWKKETKKRGFTNIKNTIKAMDALVSDNTKELCKTYNVFSETELEARYKIRITEYIKKLQTESRIQGDLATNHIIPTVFKYQNHLIENVRGLKQVLDSKDFEQVASIQLQTIKKISGRVALIKIKVKNMVEARKKANNITDIYEKAIMYSEEVRPYLEEIRYHIDHLEMVVDNEIWTLPKYRELLFAR